MATKKVTYANKIGVIPRTVQVNQVWDADMNEIKDAINSNADQQIQNTNDIALLQTTGNAAQNVSAIAHLQYLVGTNVQLQLDQTEAAVVNLYKIDKKDSKNLYQTGRDRVDTDTSVLTILDGNTLNVTAFNNIMFVNEIIIDSDANHFPTFIKDFGTIVFLADATNTPLAVGTRGVFYVGVNKLGAQVYRTSKVYDQDVCYVARMIVENLAGVYGIISYKYMPDLAINKQNNKDRFVQASGYIVPSGAASISFGNRAVTLFKNSVNYDASKIDPNYFAIADTVNPTPMQFLFALPNLTSLATSIALSTTINPSQWYNAAGAVGAGAVANTSYQVYRLLETVTKTLVIQTKASTVNTPVAGVNAIFGSREAALAGLTSVVWPDILPVGDAIPLGTFYLRAGTPVNGSGLLDSNDFYFRGYGNSTSSSTVGVTAHDLLSGKNDNPAFLHVTSADIVNWNSKSNDVDVVHKSGDEIITGKKTINALINATGLEINIPLPSAGSFPDALKITTKGINGVGGGYIGAFSVSTTGNQNYGFLFSPDVAGTGNNGFFYSKKLGAAAGNFAFRLRENAATDLFYVNDIGDLFATTAHITSPTGTTLRIEGTGVGGDMAVFTLGAGAANNAASIYSTTNNSTNNTIAFQGAPKGTRGEAFRGDSSTTIDSILWVRNLAPSHAGVIRVLHGSGGPGVQVETSGTSDDYYAYHGAGATGNPFRYNNNGVDTILFDYLGGAYFAGNVGIGTANPNLGKVQIQGSDRLLVLQGDVANAPIYQAWYNSAGTRKGYLGFAAPSSPNITFNNDEDGGHIILATTGNGNVGIGTANPGVRLEVNGYIRANNGNAGALYFGTGGVVLYGDNANTLTFGNAGGETFRITPAGNVGIGINAPFEKLTVSGNILSSTGYGGGFRLEDGFGILRQAGYTQIVYGSATAVMHFEAAGVSVIKTLVVGDNIQGNGAPTLKSIWGGAYGGAVQIKTDGATTDRYVRIGLVTGGNAWVGGMHIADNLAATFSSTVTATAFYVSSDIRLKDVVTPVHKDPTDLKSISYTWKDKEKDQKVQIGYSAQDVQQYIPEAVSKDSEGNLVVNYTQVLIAKIEVLENRIKQLENR